DLAARMAALTSAFSRARVRRVPATQIHLTLLFLGDHPAPSIPAITERTREACAGRGPVRLTPRRLMTLPERAEPRLVALECEASNNLHTLYRTLIGIFPALGEPPTPHRPTLLPHFPLARFRRGAKNRPVLSPAAIEP